MSYLKTLESSGFTTKLLASETDFEITGTTFFFSFLENETCSFN